MDGTKKGYYKESEMMVENVAKQIGRLTQHKRFMPYGTHPNFCFAKTSFILGTLGDIAVDEIWRHRKCC